jgi:hypothetical protein
LAASTPSLFLTWLAHEVGRGSAALTLSAGGGRRVGIILGDIAAKRFALGYDAESSRPYIGAQRRDYAAITEIVWSRARIVSASRSDRVHEIGLCSDCVAFAHSPGRVFPGASLRLTMAVGGCGISRWLGRDSRWVDIRRIEEVNGLPRLLPLDETPQSPAVDIVRSREASAEERSR